MILDNKSETLILEEGENQSTTSMTIDTDSHIFLMKMLSKFYADAIGSLIRETASNALDSHRAAGVKKPIIVSLESVNNRNYEFSVEDFGLGLDDNDVENIISKYGKSTKRNDATQLGAFGLGFKSPLAYSSSFYFIGRKNGIERKWLLYESDDEINKIDLLHEQETDQPNGVKVIVPVKYDDYNAFLTRIKQQLAYFEDVWFNVPTINNEDVTIYRSEHFQQSSLSKDNNLHLCLDNVYYPIDWYKLGIDNIYVPVGLRFGLSDGIIPNPNRETIKYTEETRKIILDKIKIVADYFVKKYNDTVDHKTDIFSVINFYKYKPQPFIEDFCNPNQEILVGQFKQYAKEKLKTPIIPELKLTPLDKLPVIANGITSLYKKKYTYSNNKFTPKREDSWTSDVNFSTLQSQSVYLVSELRGLKKEYLKNLMGNKTCTFIKKTKDLVLGRVTNRYSYIKQDSYVQLLKLWNYPKGEWRERIKEAQWIHKQLISSIPNVDDIDIPEDWIEARNKRLKEARKEAMAKVKQKRIAGDITIKLAVDLERYSQGKNCKFISNHISEKSLSKTGTVCFFALAEHEKHIQAYYPYFRRKGIRVGIVSKREYSRLLNINLHNWVPLSRFMEGKHKTFRKLATAILISRLYSNYSHVLGNSYILKDISSNLSSKVSRLFEYYKNNNFHIESEVEDSILELALEQNLFDTTIYDDYKHIKELLDKNPYFETLIKVIKYGWGNKDQILPILIDMCKYHKIRLDYIHYTNMGKPIKEEEEVDKQEEENFVY